MDMQTSATSISVNPQNLTRIVRKLTGWVFKIGAVFVVIASITGFIYESSMQMGDATRYPPLGQLIEVDGYTMHLHCIGENTADNPTVVFIGGGGALSYQDVSMQQRVGSLTRACIYDRAGYLWSDARPEPRTAWQLMSELHSLLHTAKIQPPVVLVGSSNGGIYARAYAYQYPDEVAGMVLVDARLETDLGKGGRLPTWILQAMGRVGMFRLFPGMICPPNACDPAYAERIAVARGSVSNLTTYEREVVEGLDESPEQARLLTERLGAGSLGDMPLIVLQANQSGVPLQSLEPRLRDYVMNYRTHLTSLSSKAQYRLINSGHGIAVEHPDVVLRAVQDVLSTVNS
jgi:pimeloyl-ACP methyl ester carboxylesterase